MLLVRRSEIVPSRTKDEKEDEDDLQLAPGSKQKVAKASKEPCKPRVHHGLLILLVLVPRARARSSKLHRAIEDDGRQRGGFHVIDCGSRRISLFQNSRTKNELIMAVFTTLRILRSESRYDSCRCPKVFRGVHSGDSSRSSLDCTKRILP